MGNADRHWTLRIARIVAATVAALIALPGVAAGHSGPGPTPARVTFSVETGGSCLEGRAPSNAAMHFVWKDAAGTVKEDVYLVGGEYRYWHYCSPDGDAIAGGDILKATVGSYTRRFVVPAVTVEVDRVTDTIHGLYPADTEFQLWHSPTPYSDDEDGEYLVSDSSGHWSFSPGYPVAHRRAYVSWWSPNVDSVSDMDVAEWVNVTIGSSVVQGESDPDRRDAKVVLRDGQTGARKAVAQVRPTESGAFSAVFLNGAGVPVQVALGDRVSGLTLASDLHFYVRAVEATADLASDTVNGRCAAGYGELIEVFRRGNRIGRGHPETAADGLFALWFGGDYDYYSDFDPANIRHGDRIKATCQLRGSDRVSASFRVP